MNESEWTLDILSDAKYEHLVAELSLAGQFILLLDREAGRERIFVAFPTPDGKLGMRTPLEDFIDQLRQAAADLAQ